MWSERLSGLRSCDISSCGSRGIEDLSSLEEIVGKGDPIDCRIRLGGLADSASSCAREEWRGRTKTSCLGLRLSERKQGGGQRTYPIRRPPACLPVLWMPKMRCIPYLGILSLPL